MNSTIKTLHRRGDARRRHGAVDPREKIRRKRPRAELLGLRARPCDGARFVGAQRRFLPGERERHTAGQR